MKLYYKDYELPSYQINDNGYLLPWDDALNDYVNRKFNYYANEISDIVIKAEDNDMYFHEADILAKINENEEGYFNFDKAILDIGAFSGCYSFRSHFKYAYSFEPNKVMYTFLNINLFMHDKLELSKTFNVLLSDKEETVKFDGFCTPYWTGEHDNFDKCNYVKSHTLDEYNLDNIGLIKVDVEGMEEKVLRGGLGTIIRNNYPPILFEIFDVGIFGTTQEKYDSLKHFLENLGYTIYWKWGDHATHLAIHKDK